MRSAFRAMAERNERLLLELLKRAGNNYCADCSKPNPEWASYNLGIFICTRCAGVHRSMGAHISKVKHLKLDKWEDSQLERMQEVGNSTARARYEERVPPCYRRPVENDPQVLIEQWIRAKYQREEFSYPERQSYTSGHMEGFLMKRGKEDNKYLPRKFVLSESEEILKYHVRDNRDPKAILKLSELNVAFAPQKIGHVNSLQLTFMKDGSTRHIYVYHDDAEAINNWYMAIRCAKLRWMQTMNPSASEDELAMHLTRDFPKEGWLWKTGPRPTDGYKKRWVTLDNRKLMYHENPLDAYPKGEIFLGHHSEGYGIRVGVVTGFRDMAYSFTLYTPERAFCFNAPCEEDRDEWIGVIDRVLQRHLTPQDSSVAARLVRKRTASNSMNIFSAR